MKINNKKSIIIILIILLSIITINTTYATNTTTNSTQITDTNNLNSTTIIETNQTIKTQKNTQYLSSTNTLNTKIIATDMNLTYKEGKSINPTLTDQNNQPLNNQQINITLYKGNQSKTYTLTTNENGTAKLPINLYPNQYQITCNYYGNENYNPTNTSINLIVNKLNTILNINNQTNIGKGDSLKLTLTDANGNPLGQQTLSVTLSNPKNQSKTYYIITDSQGIGKLQLNLAYKNYQVYYTYQGNKIYNPSNNGILKFIINATNLKANNLNIKYPGNQYFNITLTDAFGNTLPNKNINLTLTNNGIIQSYNLTTNQNGIAQLNIITNPGTYPVNFTYTDNSPYLSSTGSATITIDKLNTIITGENLNTYYNSGETYNITLYDENNNPLKYKTITINLYRNDYSITGREDKTFTYTIETNENGIAQLPINVGAGYYIISSKFLEDSFYYTSTTTNNLFINGTVLVAIDRAMAAYAGDEFTIKLKDMEGNLIPNQNIILTINSDTYNLTTNENGVASATLSYPVGNYTMNYYYAGSNQYLPSNDTSKLLISILNIKHGSLNVSPYLVATTNCQVNNALIKSTAKSLTANCTTDYEKAVAIFNFVRDETDYSGYSCTRYGAYKTLLYKVGNCCDETHLVCALSRAAGLPARYYHGTCYFTKNGKWIGHVWASVLVGNSWLVMDPTSSKNLAGYVNSWKNSNYIKKGVYATLPI